LITTITDELQAEELNATTARDAVDSLSSEEHIDTAENHAIFSMVANFLQQMAAQSMKVFGKWHVHFRSVT
jgi:hypothetical protein